MTIKHTEERGTPRGADMMSFYVSQQCHTECKPSRRKIDPHTSSQSRGHRNAQDRAPKAGAKGESSEVRESADHILCSHIMNQLLDAHARFIV
jgi:hypothetical protein